MTTLQPRPAPAAPARRRKPRPSLFALGEPMVWLTGGALAICLTMIFGLLLVVVWNGIGTFYPRPLVQIRTIGGETILGKVVRSERWTPTEAFLAGLPKSAREDLQANEGRSRRRLFQLGNFDVTGEDYRWVDDLEVADETRPRDALVIERRAWGRFQGTPVGLIVDDVSVAAAPEGILRALPERLPAARALLRERAELEGRIADNDRAQEEARLAGGKDEEKALAADGRALLDRLEKLEEEAERSAIVMRTVGGREKRILLVDVVRAFPPNQLTLPGKIGVYLSRVGEFLWANPREANTEGGVFPAIWGTLAMTMLLSVVVAPFGVLAALYLREYAKGGLTVSAVRIAVNNLAGVPSIVFGVFGLGFFCYILGAQIDELFFSDRLPNPTFGKGGLLWASLTLALLTLPVVIVATEEALAAVPSSMREGSVACGASKWQTIRRIVLPRALPGIMTGLILAIARGAGEVAPLMLVGAVKLAPDLPVDAAFPFVHPERSFMHLGFHLYDLGFQSRNSEAARPMVFTTTLLLIGLIALLNVTATWIRGRLRKRYALAKF